MLTHLRQHYLRKGLWLILLFASLFVQTQSLFACELMGTNLSVICCCDETQHNGCPMGGGCDDKNGLMSSGCCDTQVKIDIGLQDTVSVDTHHAKQVTSLDAPQPPPAIILAYQISLPLINRSHNRILNIFSPSTASLGTDTYFKTQRFRI
ncbi:hypothetical protein MNBD_GAMMA07-1285 [hydrothermal vent metagenome]|uniref:Uncharacterized protein n=1 Tax=hydrothermal vent metagenome TaxID=652676 RepID=A0A3B0X3F4_9ZZZZ